MKGKASVIATRQSSQDSTASHHHLSPNLISFSSPSTRGPESGIEVAMYVLGATLTVVAALSTWIATTQEDRVRFALHHWGDSIPALLLPSRKISQELGLTTFNNSHTPHPNNCSTCLFASGKDGSPALVGQKLPYTNYSQFKLFLLPEDSRTLALDPSLPRSGFRCCWSSPWTLPAFAIALIVASIFSSSLKTNLGYRRPVMNGNTPTDAASTINDNGNDLVVGSQENQGRKKTLFEWLIASLLRGHQSLHLRWESLSDSGRLNKAYETDGETLEGQPRPNDEVGVDTAWTDKDEAFRADHDKNVFDLENEIERTLTDAALEQKRIALIKEKDVEIESLRKKLDFTTGKFREFQREHEECRTRNVFHKTSSSFHSDIRDSV